MIKTSNASTYRKYYRYFILITLFLLVPLLSGCIRKDTTEPKTEEGQKKEQNDPDLTSEITEEPIPTKADSESVSADVLPMIDDNGTTLDTRIHTPAGFTRIPSNAKELTGFLRGLKLKKAGSKVLLYNGEAKDYQKGHAAIFDLDIGKKDLQQCADSIIRIYAEYYWSIGAYDKIAFHLTNGFLMKYTKWRDGYRLKVSGNNVSWSKTGTFDDSYEQFRKYLESVFTYAGTLSLSSECKPVSLEEMIPGDMFLKGGSPGHCVLVVDIAEDEDGKRCYLLAQGYMPAQDFHVLINPLHPHDPWYYSSEMTYPVETPQWTFDKGSLMRWGDFKL